MDLPFVALVTPAERKAEQATADPLTSGRHNGALVLVRRNRLHHREQLANKRDTCLRDASVVRVTRDKRVPQDLRLAAAVSGGVAA